MARGSSVVGGMLGLAVLGVAPSASAAAPDEGTAFRLSYDAPANACPDREAFVREIFARTQRPRLVGDAEADESAMTIKVSLETKSETSSSGRLEAREPDGTEETRSVTSRTCEEVAKGLALVAALLLDPEARTDAVVAEVPVEQPKPRPVTTTPPPTPTPTIDRPVPSPPAPRSRWQPSAGADVGMLAGIGPAVAPMAGLFFDVEHATARGLVSSARLSFDVARTQSDLARGGTQTYEWLGGTLRACPIHVALGAVSDRLRVAPCAAMQVGAHRGTTQQVANPTTSLEWWLAPAALAAVEWSLTREIMLELGGGALFPLRRTRYFLAPDTTIFDVPAVGATANLALRVRIL